MSLLVITVTISLCHVSFLTVSAAGYRYAYSIGAIGSNGNFVQNVNVAADIYGTIPGVESFYQNNATYSYLIGKNPSGENRLASSIVFLNGHATPNGIYFDDDVNFCGVTTGYNSFAGSTAGLKSINMSTCSLISFVGCSTAGGTTNLPSVAISRGAKAAIGFTEAIYSRFYNGPDWLRVFNNRIAAGYTVERAVQVACSTYPDDTLTKYVKIYGDLLTIPAEGTAASIAAAEAEDVALYTEYPIPSKLSMISNVNGLSTNAMVIAELQKIDKSFDPQDYISSFHTWYDCGNDSRSTETLVYRIGNEIDTNAAYFLNFTGDHLESIGKNCYVNNIDKSIESVLLTVVSNFRETNVYADIQQHLLGAYDVEDLFYFDYDTMTLSYRAYTFVQSYINGELVVEEGYSTEIILPYEL